MRTSTVNKCVNKTIAVLVAPCSVHAAHWCSTHSAAFTLLQSNSCTYPCHDSPQQGARAMQIWCP